MASLIPGYEYDIFISYRQKDNKHEGWVTEFVNNLKGELESTFKEEIGVYFDINPHDGLLETHDVDASLKDKLKCLIFIPIISRTYCDPKSFAWEHEFKAFVEQVSQDQFGLKVKLPNGNVANRVLPVQIHELDTEDKKLIENELGGFIRGIEFIYKEPGANKPLTSDDDENKNLNKTRYKIQVNKAAIAIKEIIQGLKTKPVQVVKEKILDKEPIKEIKKVYRLKAQEKTTKLNKGKLFSGGIGLTVLLVIVAILLYPKIFKRSSLEKLRSSGEKITVAVMPFQNMTNDTTLNVWQDGIQNELINSLTNSGELKVRQIESITGLLQSKGLTNYKSITPPVARTISQKLDANVFIYGSIKQAGATMRVNAQLIDSKTKETYKSFQIDGSAENFLHITDSFSVMIKNFLIISELNKEMTPDLQHIQFANSPEAYKYFIYGQKAFLKQDLPTAFDLLSKAVAIDSNFISAYIELSLAYYNQHLFEQAKVWCLRAYKKKDQVPMLQKTLINWIYAVNFETPYEQIKYSKQLMEFDEQLVSFSYNLGYNYNILHQYYNAIPELEKALESYKKWGSKPVWAPNYTALGIAYHNTRQYKKEKELYRKAEMDFPDDHELILRQAILSLSEGDTIKANQYIEKYIFICKENSASEADIKKGLAGIYSEAGILNKAEKYYREALSSEPEKSFRINDLAFFLIDNGRNLKEGMEFVNTALELNPEDYIYLHTKGWGLYKQGKFFEAYKFLQKADSLKPVYNHDLFLHLEAAKKAVANQKRTDR